MPGWLPPVLASAAIVLALALLWRWQRRSVAGDASLAVVLAAQGAQRCVTATTLLRRLAASDDQTRIATTLDQLELPLLQALPDCPPPTKPELADALEACARLVVRRDVAKRLMALRNALLG